MSVSLVEFLRARLDEDEQAARAASPGPWRPNAEHDEVLAVDDIPVAEGFALSGRQLRATVDHIARHDPARVLREVAAKCRLADLHEGSHECSSHGDSCTWIDGDLRPHCDTLALLAEVYDQHPDYRAEWRPAQDTAADERAAECECGHGHAVHPAGECVDVGCSCARFTRDTSPEPRSSWTY